MATISERLAYILTFDTSSGVKSVQKFGKAAEDELSRAEKANQKLSSSLQKTGAAMVAFAGVAGLGLVKLATGASDARQNFQALEQVVGTIDANDIKQWADGAAQSIGTTSSKAVEAATSFAQLGKLTGMTGTELTSFSTDLVGLAADFSAFKNVSPEQALQDIRSGFSGSVETMRKYGIFLTEGILKNTLFELTGEKVTGTLSAQQRILATNAELYKQGADMIGQFDRESESLVGQTAILKAELGNLANEVGEGVLPMLTGAVTVVGRLAESLSGTSSATKTMVGGLATIGVAGVATIGTLSLVAGQALKLSQRFRTFDADGMVTGLTRTGKAAKGVGVAMGVAAVAMGLYALEQRGAERNTARFNASMASLNEVDWGAEDATLGALAISEFMGALANDKNIKTHRDAMDQLARQYPAAAAAIAATTDGIYLSRTGMWELDQAIAKVATGQANATENEEAYAASVGETTGALDGESASAGDLSEKLKVLKEEQEAATEAAKEAAEAARDAADAMLDQADAHLSLADLASAQRLTQMKLNETTAGSTEALAELEEGTHAYAAELDSQVGDAKAAAKASADMAKAMFEANGVTWDASENTSRLNRSLLDAARAADGPFRDALIETIAQMNGIGEGVVGEILLIADADAAAAELDAVSVPRTAQVTAEARTAAADEQLRQLTLPWEVLVTTRFVNPGPNPYLGPGGGTQNVLLPTSTTTTSTPKSTNRGVREFAFGTTFSPGGSADVGEAGRERVDLPLGAKVRTYGQTTAAERAEASQWSTPPAAPPVNLTFSGPIYGVPPEEFWDMATEKINERLAGRL